MSTPTHPRRAPSRAGSDEPGRQSVLIVDDDAACLRVMARLVRRCGFTPISVTGPDQAERAALEQSVTVVVVDLGLGDSSGLDLVARLRRAGTDAPVVLVTGAPSLDSAVRSMELGAVRYLAKPFESAAFRDAICSAVSGAASREATALVDVPLGRELARAGARFSQTLDGLWLAWQPILDAATGGLWGAEALMRSDDRTLVNPGLVLTAAERLGRMQDLGRIVRARVAEAAVRAPAEIRLFVNLHPTDLLDPQLFSARAPLSRFARQVVLEVTERATLAGITDLPSRLSRLRCMGFSVAIDDLGQGYAGLSSFLDLRPEIVKIDMSVVRGVHECPRRQGLIRMISALSTEFGFLVVAEGLEVADELATVRDLGVQLLQGYHLGRPRRGLPASDTVGGVECAEQPGSPPLGGGE